MGALRVSSRNLEQGSSFSGHERNHLFLNLGGEEFADVSAISGLDHPGDGRAFSWLDFDRDGWLDAAVVGANAPRLLLYRNLGGERTPTAEGAMQMIALRFVGGNTEARINPAWSNRDGYGAKVEVEIGNTVLLREHRAGEGMAAQNSSTMIIGIGSHSTADNVRVRWPSGIVQNIGPVEAGKLITVYEDSTDGSKDRSFITTVYAKDTSRPQSKPTRSLKPTLLPLVSAQEGQRLILYTTMATWCGPCLKEIPALKNLQDAIGESVMTMVGLPYDENESEAQLDEWRAKYQPPYNLLTGLPNSTRLAAKKILKDALKIDALPATLVTDTQGKVLLTRFGPPTESQIRALLQDGAQ
ncbi:MAG: ASPIC/UnbV domain-containing protein [Halioglobus sp.]